MSETIRISTITCCESSAPSMMHIYSSGKRPPQRTIGVSRSINAATLLLSIPHPRFKLRHPIGVSVRWSDEMQAYCASETMLGLWSGIGRSSAAALDDLGRVLVEVYEDLRTETDELAPHLQHSLDVLTRVLGDADQDP